MKDYNIQHKGVGEGDKVGINQKIGDKRKWYLKFKFSQRKHLIKGIEQEQGARVGVEQNKSK